METLIEKALPSGEILTVKHWVSSEPAPRKYKDYILASFGMDHPHSSLYTINGWRGYFSDAMDGNFYPEVVDHWFFAEINGECAGRIWFAYSAKSGYGNFGNVATEPQFRQRGIMKELMNFFCEEFQRSPATMLCCATGNKIAAASYLKFGFKFVYTGPTGPMYIAKGEDFHAKAANAFAAKDIFNIRPGRIDDQFDCDKLLNYIPEVWRRPTPFFAGVGSYVEDFRLAYQEQLGDRGVVYVAENSLGHAVGYAFAFLAGRIPVIDFLLHPGCFGAGAEKLLQETCRGFTEKFPTIPSLFYTGFADDQEKLSIVTAAGGINEGQLTNSLVYGENMRDMRFCRFNLIP